MKQFIAAAALAGLACTIPPAHAQSITATRAVSFADLNLASPAGRAALDARLRAAAGEVCGMDNGREVLTITAERQACYRAALTAARAAAPAPRAQLGLNR